MAALTGALKLTRAVVTLAGSDPSITGNTVVAGTSGSVGGGGTRSDAFTLEGQFRNYANGNTRLILGTATTRVQTFALPALNPTQVLQIEALTGQIVCFRDTYGRKVYGAYLAPTFTDLPLSGRVADGSLVTGVTLTIQSVTYSEAV